VLNLTFESMTGSTSSSTYIAESIDLWHDRLGHVNFASINDSNI